MIVDLCEHAAVDDLLHPVASEEIVRKTTYATVSVKEGDRVEVVQFMGGGAKGASA